MHGDNYVAGLEGDDGVGKGGGVIEELLNVLHRVLGWGGLLHGEGAEGREHHHVDGTCVVEEDTYAFLYMFLISLAEGGVVFLRIILHPLPIVGFDVGVMLMLRAFEGGWPKRTRTSLM